MALQPPPWMDEAACRDADPTDFFPESGGGATAASRRALAICAECTVKADCLIWAMADTNSAHHGIYAGLLGNQRYGMGNGPACPAEGCDFRSINGLSLAAHMVHRHPRRTEGGAGDGGRADEVAAS